MPAQLILLSGQTHVDLCDISQSGARFRLQEETDLGTDGVLMWLEFEAFGRIVWHRGGFGAVEFDEVLDIQVLLETREKVDHKLIKTQEQLAYQKSRDWYCGYS